MKNMINQIKNLKNFIQMKIIFKVKRRKNIKLIKLFIKILSSIPISIISMRMFHMKKVDKILICNKFRWKKIKNSMIHQIYLFKIKH